MRSLPVAADSCIMLVNIAFMCLQALTGGPFPLGTSEIQPWKATFMQHRLPQLRLLRYGLEHAPGKKQDAQYDC